MSQGDNEVSASQDSVTVFLA